MKKLLTLFVCLFLTTSAWGISYTDFSLPVLGEIYPETIVHKDIRNGLVLDYDFRNISGNRIINNVKNTTDGTLIDSPSNFSLCSGASGIRLNDSTQYVETNFVPADVTKPFTYIVIAKPDIIETSGYMIGQTWALTPRPPVMYVTSGQISISYRDSGGNTRTATGNFTANTCNIFVGVYTGSVLEIYVNGKLGGTGATTLAPSASATNLRIGSATAAFFGGVVGGARVYNRALSNIEVYELTEFLKKEYSL